MKLHPYFAAGALLLALTACRPGAAEYTAAEAPKQLTVDNASTMIAVRFAPGSSRLQPADAARLRRMAAAGDIGPADRVTVSAAGSPILAVARFNAISRELVGYGIAPTDQPLARLAPDQAIIETGRYLVTLPPCPNWSKPPALGFTNTPSSNFGCATAVDLGRMVWRPADLAQGVVHGPNYIENASLTNTQAVFGSGAAQAVPGGAYSASVKAIGAAVNVTGCPAALPPPATGTSTVTPPAPTTQTCTTTPAQ